MTMRVIIAGSRDIRPAKATELVTWSMDQFMRLNAAAPTAIICGMARGIDTAGNLWAEDHGIDVIEMPADWDAHGKAAGPIRNREMAMNADALVLIHHGSAGSKSMLAEAEKRDLILMELTLNKDTFEPDLWPPHTGL